MPSTPACPSSSSSSPRARRRTPRSTTAARRSARARSASRCRSIQAVDGTVATLSPANQTCSIGQQDVSIIYTAGTIAFTGGMATVSLMGKYTGTCGPVPAMGTATLLASCQRQ